jgi:uncharacterized membrane protein
MEVSDRRTVPRWIIATSLALSLVGAAIATYLTYTHYTDPSALACPDSGVVNCTLVTTSTWSVIFGVPVALLGLIWALAMTALSLPLVWRSPWRWLDWARSTLAVAGTGMVLYLVYVELFRIGAICLWCTGVHLTAILLFAVILVARTSMIGGEVGQVGHTRQ